MKGALRPVGLNFWALAGQGTGGAANNVQCLVPVSCSTMLQSASQRHLKRLCYESLSKCRENIIYG